MKRPTQSDRRTVLKTIGVGIVGGATMTGTASAHDNGFGYPGDQPEEADLPPVFPTWGSDGTDHHEMLDTSQPQNSNHHAHRPFYHIAPSGGDHSPHLFVFDNVVDTPSSGGGKYSAMWHVNAVLDTNEPAPPGSDAPPHGLASFTNPTVSKVEDAIANDPNIYKIDFGLEFVCPTRPHKGE